MRSVVLPLNSVGCHAQRLRAKRRTTRERRLALELLDERLTMDANGVDVVVVPSDQNTAGITKQVTYPLAFIGSGGGDSEIIPMMNPEGFGPKWPRFIGPVDPSEDPFTKDFIFSTDATIRKLSPLIGEIDGAWLTLWTEMGGYPTQKKIVEPGDPNDTAPVSWVIHTDARFMDEQQQIGNSNQDAHTPKLIDVPTTRERRDFLSTSGEVQFGIDTEHWDTLTLGSDDTAQVSFDAQVTLSNKAHELVTGFLQGEALVGGSMTFVVRTPIEQSVFLTRILGESNSGEMTFEFVADGDFDNVCWHIDAGAVSCAGPVSDGETRQFTLENLTNLQPGEHVLQLDGYVGTDIASDSAILNNESLGIQELQEERFYIQAGGQNYGLFVDTQLHITEWGWSLPGSSFDRVVTEVNAKVRGNMPEATTSIQMEFVVGGNETIMSSADLGDDSERLRGSLNTVDSIFAMSNEEFAIEFSGETLGYTWWFREEERDFGRLTGIIF